jgi:hypothetical protein
MTMREALTSHDASIPGSTPIGIVSPRRKVHITGAQINRNHSSRQQLEAPQVSIGSCRSFAIQLPASPTCSNSPECGMLQCTGKSLHLPARSTPSLRSPAITTFSACPWADYLYLLITEYPISSTDFLRSAELRLLPYIRAIPLVRSTLTCSTPLFSLNARFTLATQ